MACVLLVNYRVPQGDAVLASVLALLHHSLKFMTSSVVEFENVKGRRFWYKVALLLQDVLDS